MAAHAGTTVQLAYAYYCWRVGCVRADKYGSGTHTRGLVLACGSATVLRACPVLTYGVWCYAGAGTTRAHRTYRVLHSGLPPVSLAVLLFMEAVLLFIKVPSSPKGVAATSNGSAASYGGCAASYGGCAAIYGGCAANYGGFAANYGGCAAIYGGCAAIYGGCAAIYGGCALLGR
eukprot:3195940-Rhodomonas_salina.4